MSDKLPRLNYLTMYAGMLQYQATGNSEQAGILEIHVYDIWRSLPDNDKMWLYNRQYDTVEQVNELIELVYSENDNQSE